MRGVLDAPELVRLRSPVSARMLIYLASAGRAFARELAEEASIDTRSVYPYLKPWIGRLVEVVKVCGVNLYRATDRLLKVREVVADAVGRVRGKVVRQKVLAEAMKRFRERFGTEMDEDHLAVLQVFLDHALSTGSPYIRVDPSKGETLPKVLRTAIRAGLGVDVDEERIIEALKELELAKLVYIDRRFYKARLDRSLLGAGRWNRGRSSEGT